MNELDALPVAMAVCFIATIVLITYRGVRWLYRSLFKKTGKKKKLFNPYKLQKWSSQVRKRDGACRVCNSKKNGQSHHLYDKSTYPEKAYDSKNGVRLCRSCHSLFHSIFMGGTSNSCTPDDFKRFKGVFNALRDNRVYA